MQFLTPKFHITLLITPLFASGDGAGWEKKLQQGSLTSTQSRFSHFLSESYTWIQERFFSWISFPMAFRLSVTPRTKCEIMCSRLCCAVLHTQNALFSMATLRTQKQKKKDLAVLAGLSTPWEDEIVRRVHTARPASAAWGRKSCKLL